MSEFSEAFRRARLTSGLTFRQIREKVGMSIGFWSDMENGKRNPPDLQKVAEVEKALGVQDGHLVRLAKRVQAAIPSSLGRLIEGRPELGEVLFRADALTPEELETLLSNLRQKSPDGDFDPFFLDWDSIAAFDKIGRPF